MNHTPDLFDQPRARASHPETSHAAARSVDRLNEKREAVLKVFQEKQSLTLEELLEAYALRPDLPKQSPSGIRSRCSELVGMGLVGDSGLTRPSVSGRACVVWRVVG